MASKSKNKKQTKAKTKVTQKKKPAKPTKARPKAAAKKPTAPQRKPTLTLKPAPAKAKEAGKTVTLGPAATPAKDAAKPARAAKRSSRKSALSQRRGPDGQLFVPGDLLVPGGPKDADELQYFFRGCSAAEHAGLEPGVEEVIAKRGGDASVRPEVQKHANAMSQRFDSGSIEPLLPNRSATARRTFQTVIERAKHRRREIGAFMRGLDMGRTETSHMDSHGEASLQSLMEWAARLENLAEADEPEQADYVQFHRVLDQLDNTTEALIIDVELTLRRLRDRLRTH